MGNQLLEFRQTSTFLLQTKTILPPFSHDHNPMTYFNTRNVLLFGQHSACVPLRILLEPLRCYYLWHRSQQWIGQNNTSVPLPCRRSDECGVTTIILWYKWLQTSFTAHLPVQSKSSYLFHWEYYDFFFLSLVPWSQ